jgi:uncharacterized protein Yka (UPF0111/DUF47 family)
MTELQRRGKKRNPVQLSHGFRKFVNTSMVTAKLSDQIRNMLLGHSIALDKAYYKPKESDLLDDYLKAVDLLTINEENRLRKKVHELTKQEDRLDNLQQQIAELGQKLGFG